MKVKRWAAKRERLEERRWEERDEGTTGVKGEGIREVKAEREEEHELEIRRGRHNFIFLYNCVFVVLIYCGGTGVQYGRLLPRRTTCLLHVLVSCCVLLQRYLRQIAMSQ